MQHEHLCLKKKTDFPVYLTNFFIVTVIIITVVAVIGLVQKA